MLNRYYYLLLVAVVVPNEACFCSREIQPRGGNLGGCEWQGNNDSCHAMTFLNDTYTPCRSDMKTTRHGLRKLSADPIMYPFARV